MSARSSIEYRTRSSSAKRSLSFSSPCTSVVSPPRLSPSQAKPTDRVLTFLQSARDRNVPVRSGKWSSAEDAYLAKLIWLFKAGLLADMEPKTSLRSFLAIMLNCCPMRISKKQMHGHSFMGKIKYVPQVSNMTQQQYDALCHEVWTLRDEFLQAWAKDEYVRRTSTVRMYDTSFQDWYDKVIALVPTPKLVNTTSLKGNKKRRIGSFDAITSQVQEIKTQQIDNVVTVPLQKERPEQECVRESTLVEMLEPTTIVPLDPIFVSESTLGNKVTALPTAYCEETLKHEDWLDPCYADAQYVDFKSDRPGEANHTLCEDQVQVSVHLKDQEPASPKASMTRRSPNLIIDFGAPSCWYTGEEPKPFSDYPQWLSEDLIMATESGMFNWDDAMPLPYVTSSPTISFS